MGEYTPFSLSFSVCLSASHSKGGSICPAMEKGVGVSYIPPSCHELSRLPHSHFSFFPTIVQTHASFTPAVSPSCSPLPPLYALALDYTHAYTLIVPPLTCTVSCYLSPLPLMAIVSSTGIFSVSCTAWHVLLVFLLPRLRNLTAFSVHRLSAQLFLHLVWDRIKAVWKSLQPKEASTYGMKKEELLNGQMKQTCGKMCQDV